MDIPVFLASDENYVPYAAVTIASICSNTNAHCKIYLLATDISNESRQKILELQNNFKNLSIEIINIDDDKDLKGLEVLSAVGYISKATYNRLLIPDLKPEVDKAVYLDVDIIVPGDISELYKEDLGNYIIGAVWEEAFEETMNQKRIKNLNLSPEHKYFNSGVMLMDCKKWRQEKLFDKILKLGIEINDILECMDQDIFNKFFDNNYKILPAKYNHMTQDCHGYNEYKNIVIRHFTGPIKPWHCYQKRRKGMPNLADFWKYARMTAFYETLKSKALENMKQIRREKRAKKLKKFFGFFFRNINS